MRHSNRRNADYVLQGSQQAKPIIPIVDGPKILTKEARLILFPWGIRFCGLSVYRRDSETGKRDIEGFLIFCIR